MHDLMLPTRQLDPGLKQLIVGRKPGQRIRIIQTVRVGEQLRTTTVDGTCREWNYLVTGLSTDRVPEDDIVVPAVHFTKDNGELSSITLDEHTQISLVESPAA